VQPEDTNPCTLYLLRAPNGELVPGRVLETHRLWELRFAGPLPRVSIERAVSNTADRVIGYLALADRISCPRDGQRDHLECPICPGLRKRRELLLQAPCAYLSEDPGEASSQLLAYHQGLYEVPGANQACPTLTVVDGIYEWL